MNDTRPCPYCGEMIKTVAIKCRWCGNMVDTGSPIPVTDQISHVRMALATRYEIMEEIGHGGMSIVYRAIQKNLGRQVAIKVIRYNLIHDEDLVLRFHKEAALAASLNHPNIIKIYDEGVEGGIHYMVMEYLEGKSLNIIIEESAPLTVGDTLALISPIAGALDYMHHMGLVHRDIKSSNIFVDLNYRCVLMDFGIAYGFLDSVATQPGTVIGTPEFMSPEQALGKTVDGRSDLYSLGVVMYQCLTKSVPFRADNPITILSMITTELPEPLKKLNGNVPDWLESIVMSLLEKDPVNRIPTGALLIDSIKNKKQIKKSTKKYAPVKKTNPPLPPPVVKNKKVKAVKKQSVRNVHFKDILRQTGSKFNSRFLIKIAIGLTGLLLVFAVFKTINNSSNKPNTIDSGNEPANDSSNEKLIIANPDTTTLDATNNKVLEQTNNSSNINSVNESSQNYSNQNYTRDMEIADNFLLQENYEEALKYYLLALRKVNASNMNEVSKQQILPNLNLSITTCNNKISEKNNETEDIPQSQ